MSELNAKRIVLLGGTSGFGLATAKAAAKEGANVIVVSSNQARVDATVAALPAGAQGYAVNLTNETAVKELFEKLGSIDHLVYTAGENLKFGEVQALDFDESRNFFNIRFWGALMAAKYAAKNINPGGSINLTNGVVGLRPMKGWAVAAALTGTIEALTRALAVELAPIRVNAVCAGMVDTALWHNIPEPERQAMFKQFGGQLLVGRVGEAEEIALSYLYLMKQTFSTGQVIVVDGGAVLV